MRRLALALAVPVLLTATAGCSKGGAAPTQEQYAQAADQMCKDSAKKIDDLYMDQAVETLRSALEGGETPVYVDRPQRWLRAKIVPAYQGLSNALKGIQPPDGDVAYLTDLYADLDARITMLHRRPGDGRALIEDDELLRDRFVSYGIDKCPPPFDPEPAYEDPGVVAAELADRQEAERERAAEAGGETTEPSGETTAPGE